MSLIRVTQASDNKVVWIKADRIDNAKHKPMLKAAPKPTPKARKKNAKPE